MCSIPVLERSLNSLWNPVQGNAEEKKSYQNIRLHEVYSGTKPMKLFWNALFNKCTLGVCNVRGCKEPGRWFALRLIFCVEAEMATNQVHGTFPSLSPWIFLLIISTCGKRQTQQWIFWEKKAKQTNTPPPPKPKRPHATKSAVALTDPMFCLYCVNALHALRYKEIGT